MLPDPFEEISDGYFFSNGYEYLYRCTRSYLYPFPFLVRVDRGDQKLEADILY